MLNHKYIYILVFSSLAGWAIFAYFTTTKIIQSQQEYANIINISGKQRMLSQKTALIAKRYYEEKDDKLKEHLHGLYLLMKSDHEYIVNEHVLSKKIIKIYHSKPKTLNLKVLKYLELLLSFLDQPKESILTNIEIHSYALLPLLDEAVYAFEQESNDKTELLMNIELFILVGTLLTLLFEAIFIVLPAIRLASQHESELNVLIQERTAKLEELSVTDQLTKLYNRRYIDKTLTSELERAKRYHHIFSVIMLDIDHFKTINDTYGHQVGDYVLEDLSRLLTSNIRKTDMVGRWGGEEFLIITTEEEFSKVLKFADKLRQIIDSHSFDVVQNVTCSFGVTHYINNDTEVSIVSRADSALYEAKKAGRNCVKSLLS